MVRRVPPLIDEEFTPKIDDKKIKMSAKLPKLNLENLASSQEDVIRVSPQISDTDSNESSNEPSNEPTIETSDDNSDDSVDDAKEEQEAPMTTDVEQELMDTLKSDVEPDEPLSTKETVDTQDSSSEEDYQGTWTDPVEELFPYVSPETEWTSETYSPIGAEDLPIDPPTPRVEDVTPASQKDIMTSTSQKDEMTPTPKEDKLPTPRREELEEPTLDDPPMPPEEDCPSTPECPPSTPMCSKTPPRSVLFPGEFEDDEQFHGPEDIEVTPVVTPRPDSPQVIEEPAIIETPPPAMLELRRYRDIRIPYVREDALKELSASEVTTLSGEFHFVFNDDDGIIKVYGIPRNPLITYDMSSSQDEEDENKLSDDPTNEPTNALANDIKEAVETKITDDSSSSSSSGDDEEDDIDQGALDLMAELEKKNDPTMSPVSQVSTHTIPRKYLRGKKILVWGACAFIPVAAVWATQWLIN